MDDNAQSGFMFITDEGRVRIPVIEIISTFWGTGMFKNATGEITADGYIDVTDSDNLFAHFDLSGTVCVK